MTDLAGNERNTPLPAVGDGVNVKRYNLIYLFMIVVIVALGVKMVGGLVTAALVAIEHGHFSRDSALCPMRVDQFIEASQCKQGELALPI